MNKRWYGMAGNIPAGYNDALTRRGKERREKRKPESPCARCKRTECPRVCFPLRDYRRAMERR